MALYEDQFEDRFDFPNSAPTRRTLIIASTPRCGSHYLGHALQGTGLFGSPFEYANPVNLQRWQSVIGTVDMPEAIRAIMARRTSENGVFAIKVHWSHIGQFGSVNRMLGLFPDARFFHIRRRDLVGQAISFAIARQNGVWISGQEGNGRVPEYDFQQVYRCLGTLVDHNAAWQAAIAQTGLPFDGMDFEDIRKDLPAAVDRVASLLHIDLPSTALDVSEKTEKQSGERNAEWRARFLEDVASSRYRPARMAVDFRRVASMAKGAMSR